MMILCLILKLSFDHANFFKKRESTPNFIDTPHLRWKKTLVIKESLGVQKTQN